MTESKINPNAIVEHSITEDKIDEGFIKEFRDLQDSLSKVPVDLGDGDNSVSLKGGNHSWGLNSSAFGLGNTSYGWYSSSFGYSKRDIMEYFSLEEIDLNSDYSSEREAQIKNLILDKWKSISNRDEKFSIAFGLGSFVSGRNCIALGQRSISMGLDNISYGDNAASFGQLNEVKGNNGFAFGLENVVEGWCAGAEGEYNKAIGASSHAQGRYLMVQGIGAHAEGLGTEDYSKGAFGNYSHCEGGYNTTLATYSHAEGANNTAEGLASHAEGRYNTAKGKFSHAEGKYTCTHNEAEHASGVYNESIESTDPSMATLYSVGVGSSSKRKNAYEVKQNGDVYILGVGGFTGDNSKDSQSVQEVIQSLVNLINKSA